jgi:organic hydroperoxide reductase OsmC/OhrA
VTGEAKPTIPGTADPAFRGDPTRWNPEELLVASLSQCHMLEFLARAARASVVVTRVTFRHSFVELVTVADDRHGGPGGR